MQEIVIEIFTINQHTLNNIQLEMINITLNTSTWKIYGLNVLIQKAVMVKTQLLLESFAKKKYLNFLTIYKSKFYSLEVNGGYNITISECHFVDNVTLDSTIIKVYNSVLNIMNSTFRNIGKLNSGSAIIDAANSLILIKSVHVSDNYASNGLIEISNGSHLQIERSFFGRNGNDLLYSSIIFIKINSVVKIYHCKFGDNSALYGSCFTTAVNSSLIVYNSTFALNSAVRGGVTYHQGIEIFYRNGLHGSEKQMSFKHYLNKSLTFRYYIVGCSFYGNSALEGGDIYIKGFYFQVKLMKSHFSSFAFIGGSMLIGGTDTHMTDVLISQCVLEGQAWVGGGSIYVERTNINIIDSYFTNSAPIGPGEYILATNYSVVNVKNTSFHRGFVTVGSISIRTGVELYVTQSKFNSPHIFPPTLAYIAATDNCSVFVTKSYFGNRVFPSFVVAFDIGMFTNLIVLDSIFEGKNGLNFYIVDGYNNANIHFANCKFHKVSGFKASNESTIFIQDSTIAHCINTLQEGLIHISCKSALNISNTTITGNSIVKSSSIILVQSQSFLIVLDSSYFNNIMAKHIVVDNDCDIKIKGSEFFNNTVVNSRHSTLKGLLITVTNDNTNKNYTGTLKSSVFVQETVFRRNSNYEWEFFINQKSLISLQSSKNVTLLKNKFIDNYQLTIVSMTGMEQNYLKVISCTFKDNYGNSICTDHVTDVIIANSYFKRKKPRGSEGIKIEYVLTVRVFNSTFNRTHGETQIGFPLTLQMDTVALYTTNSTFVGKHKSLRTNAKKFLKKAESAGFIDNEFIPKINHAETPYASGNNFSVLICFRLG